MSVRLILCCSDKDKKGGKAALPAPKKGDPVPPKGSKPAEDPKTKKIAANAADDKKGPKKGALPPAKGKKGKDEKDETDDVCIHSVNFFKTHFSGF